MMAPMVPRTRLAFSYCVRVSVAPALACSAESAGKTSNGIADTKPAGTMLVASDLIDALEARWRPESAGCHDLKETDARTAQTASNKGFEDNLACKR